MDKCPDTIPTDQPNQHGLVASVFCIFLLTLLALCCFQSSALITLAYDLTPGPATENIVTIAEVWHQWMEQIGASGMTQTITEKREELHDIPLR